MGAYRYEAVDGEGKPRRGLIEAESPRQVRDRLRSEGLFPTAIDAAGGEGGGDGRERLHLPPAQVALATRQLATLARSDGGHGPSAISIADWSASGPRRAGWPKCSNGWPITSRRARR